MAKESFPKVARRLADSGWPTWKIAQQLKVTEAQVVKWVSRNR